MTTADLYKELARLAEENAALQQCNAALQTELASRKLFADPVKEWFTVKEAAELIKRSPAFLDKDRMREMPVIPYTKEGYRTVRYHISDLQDYNDARKLRRVV